MKKCSDLKSLHFLYCLAIDENPRFYRGKMNALVKIKTHHAKEWCKNNNLQV